MTNKWNRTILAALCALAPAHAWPQTPELTTLDLEWENGVVYADDVPDPYRLVTSPNAINISPRNFMSQIAIGDIVSVNGRPARGTWVGKGHFINAFPSATAGQAIADLGRGVIADMHLEILQADGTRVGLIMTTRFVGGPAPPGSASTSSTSGTAVNEAQDPFSNFAVTGGTGAFLGAKGFMINSPFTIRIASTAEDPANRRTHGGGRGRWIVSLIPLTRPDVVTTATGPAVFHADFSPVTAARPARAGETLIVRATGLGPTRPGLTAGALFPADPLQEVNSPVEATINGNAAAVLNKIGWPGTNDVYRVDFRVPDGTAAGMAALRLIAAFVSGREVSIPIQ